MIFSREAAATVDGENLPRNEICRREKENSIGDFRTFTSAMERRAANVILVGLFAGKLNRAGRDAVDKNLGG